jgi:hypothetical protein
MIASFVLFKLCRTVPFFVFVVVAEKKLNSDVHLFHLFDNLTITETCLTLYGVGQSQILFLQHYYYTVIFHSGGDSGA